MPNPLGKKEDEEQKMGDDLMEMFRCSSVSLEQLQQQSIVPCCGGFYIQ